MNLYQENILDHYKNPRLYGELKNHNKTIEGANIFCGDEIKYFFKLSKNDKILQVSWTAQACAICMASCSILSEQIINQNLESVSKITKEQILTNLGIKLSPTRLKCALLPLETLKKIYF